MDRGQREHGTAEGGAEGRRWKQWPDCGIVTMWERRDFLTPANIGRSSDAFRGTLYGM